MEHERYLGDGLYASFDGWNIWLHADREGQRHMVALEPEVLTAFKAYADDVWKKADDAPQAAEPGE